VKRKIAAILAADVVGYSRMIAEDEEDTLARLASYAAVFSDFITRFGGRIFNTAGDAILAEFESAVDAVRCAVDIQESLRARNLAYPPSRQMRFRIGITIGDVVEREGDLLGDGVNVAARLESSAPDGGICVSRSVHEAVANKLSVSFSDKGELHLKNMPDPVRAYTVNLGVKSTGRKEPSRTTSLFTRYWGVLVAALVVVAGIAGFMFAAREQSGQEVDPTPAAATNAPSPKTGKSDVASSASSSTIATSNSASPADAQDTAKNSEERAPSADEKQTARLPASDPAARQAILKRKWKDCFEGDKPEKIANACSSLIDYEVYEGDDLASIYVELGRAQRKKEEIDAAIKAYSEAISLKPSARAYNNRGIAYFDKGDWQKAIDDYTEAIRLNSRYGEAFNNRAWTRFKARRARNALADADKAVRLLPRKSYAWDTRAHVQEALGNRNAAINDFRKALDLDPNNEASRSGLRRLGVQP